MTSNDAGLAVPDWPLSFGTLMPEMVGGVFYEHGHRLIAGSVALMTLVLAVWLGLREERAWVRRLGFAALAGVLIQALLGGLTVILQLPVIVSVLHACVAQAFFCAVVAIAFLSSRYWHRNAHSIQLAWQRPEFRAGCGLFLAVYLQLILGAILRHSGTVGGTKGAVIEPLPLLGHVLGAVLVSGLLFFAVISLLRLADPPAHRFAYTLIALLALQLVLGLGALMVRLTAAGRPQPLPVHAWVTTGHVALGALLLGTSLVLALYLTRRDLAGAEATLPRHLAEGAS